MNKTAETFIPTFKPLLRRYANSYRIVQYIDAFNIPNEGFPAPTLNGNMAAYWIGTPQQPDDELPILAISIPTEKHAFQFGRYWSIGAARISDIKAHGEFLQNAGQSTRPLAAAVLEFAHTGPYVYNQAFEHIQQLCPIPKTT